MNWMQLEIRRELDFALWRFFIGAGSYEQGAASGIEGVSARRMFPKSGWRRYNKQLGQQWFLQAAKDRGVKYILGFTCSPPVYMTRNGKAHGLVGSEAGKLNLSSDKYDDFAAFLVNVVKHFTNSGKRIEDIQSF